MRGLWCGEAPTEGDKGFNCFPIFVKPVDKIARRAMVDAGVQANFVQKQYALTLSSSTSGQIGL